MNAICPYSGYDKEGWEQRKITKELLLTSDELARCNFKYDACPHYQERRASEDPQKGKKTC